MAEINGYSHIRSLINQESNNFDEAKNDDRLTKIKVLVISFLNLIKPSQEKHLVTGSSYKGECTAISSSEKI